MEISEIIELMPHHIAIFIEEKEDNYKEWVANMRKLSRDLYTEKSIKRMATFFRRLSKSPEVKIKVVDKGNNKKNDYLCSFLCDNWTSGECKISNDNNLLKKLKEEEPIYRSGKYDTEPKLKYNLSDGQIITVEELLLKNKI